MKRYLGLLFCILFLINSIFSQSINEVWLESIDKGKEEYAVNNYNEALEHFTEASKIVPTDTTAYFYMMDCAYKVQNSEVVYKCIEKLGLLNTESVRYYIMAVNVAVNADKDFQMAINYAETAMQKFGSSKDLLFAYMNIYYQYGDYDETKKRIKEIISQYPDSKKEYDLLIHIHYAIEGDLDATLNALLEAQKAFPDEVEYVKREVNIYLEKGELDQAEEKFRKLIEVSPQEPKHYYNLSLILHNKGEYEQSVEFASKAIELDPDFLEAIFNVGTFFYYRALQYNQALTDMTAYQYTYEQQGKQIEEATRYFFHQAKPYFQRAIELNPDELGAFENLNTINVLLENLEKNMQQAEPLYVEQTDELLASAPNVQIDEVNFIYPENGTNIRKGETGEIQIKFSNLSNDVETGFEAVLMQPFINTFIAFEDKIKIDTLHGYETKTISIPVEYQLNSAEKMGIEKVEGVKDVIRLFIVHNSGYCTELEEVRLLTGNSGDASVDFSETVDIIFSPEVKPTNFLLCIGIDDYQYWPKLSNAVGDAQNVKNVLLERYEVDKENVFELMNTDATKSNMINELIKIKQDLGEEDNLIIYYAGHGDYNSTTDEGAWVPVNATKDESLAEYLDNTTLLSYLNALNTKHTFLIADACFSGSLFVSNDEMSYKPNNDKVKSRWGFTSGNIEYVADGLEGEGSPFAQFLIEALERNRRDHIAVTELISYVKFMVRNANAQTPIGRPLKLEGNEGGEFLLYAREGI